MNSKPLALMHEVERTFLQGGQPLHALRCASCEVQAGDRIAIVGPSGSGKSTTLHLLGGIDVPSRGTVEWPALGAREHLRPRKVQFVFQKLSLVDALTASENVELPLLLCGSNPQEARRAALRLLEELDLALVAGKLPEELSGGQAQRVAVARALITRPRLLLADEPTGQLDHPTAQRLFDVLLDALEGTDTALVVATHDLDIAARMNGVWKVAYGRLETK
jgi:ABC-type lipoprotein export system ATPase subunit